MEGKGRRGRKEKGGRKKGSLSAQCQKEYFQGHNLTVNFETI